MRRFLILFLVLLGAASLRAQSVHWEPADAGDPSQLQLLFDNCSPDSNTPGLPSIPGFTLTPLGTSTQQRIDNGTVTNSFALLYQVRSQHGGRIQIPAFTVDTDKGPQPVAAYSGAAVAAAIDVGTSSTLSTPDNFIWAGQVFPLTYTLNVPRRYFNQLGTGIDWSAAPLLAEEWSKPDATETTANGEAQLNINYRTRAYAKTPGTVTLNAAQQVVNVQTGSTGFGFFQQLRVEQISVTSNRPELTVRPLPAGAPASFNGAVGQFTLVSKVVPATAAVGEPVTWTLTLAGSGNWPDIPGLPARDVSRDFQVVQPQAKRTTDEGKLFDASLVEDVVLVPSRPGTYALGPVSYTYFDPRSASYKTLTTEKFTVTVSAPSAPQISLTLPGTAPAAAPGEGAAVQAKPPAPPGPPAPIPRDPLPGSGHAPVPMPVRTLELYLLSPFAAVLVLWLALAFRRARITDPLRPRREAHRRLAATLARLGSATDQADRARLLLAWQQDAATLWAIAHATPPASAFSTGQASGTGSDWAALWNEADRTLYAAETALPADWIERASAALAAKRVDSFSSLQLFLPQNLLPFAAALMLAALVTARALAQEGSIPADPIAAYNRGDFAGAEKSWRAALAADPTDWRARHNLSLALAQQDRPGEAAAEAAAAFVQHPRDPSVRWHLGPAFEKAGFTPAPFASFVPPGPAQESAWLASPAEWQWALVLASVLAAGALALCLLQAYGWQSSWARPCAISVLAVALLLAFAGFFGRSAYGIAGDARAVVAWKSGGLLRSIPTEADTTQKTSALPPGSVALVDKSFLGWVRLSFENGQTGWVRKEELVYLWQ